MGGSADSFKKNFGGSGTTANVLTMGTTGALGVLTGGESDKIVDKISGMVSYKPHKTDNVSTPIKQADDIDAAAIKAKGDALKAAQAQGYTSAGTTIDQSQANQSRQYQDQLSQMLLAQSQGQGPSLAQGQFQQNTDQALAQQIALAASQRGGYNPAANRTAANNIGAMGLTAANQAAQLRMQEQLASQGLLAQNAGTTRGQDASLATSQAQLGQQNNQFNAGQQQQNSQFNANQQAAIQQLQYQYQALGMSADQANQAALYNYQNQLMGQAATNAGIDAQNTAGKNAWDQTLFKTAASAATLGASGLMDTAAPAAAAAAPATPMATSSPYSTTPAMASQANTTRAMGRMPEDTSAFSSSDENLKTNIVSGEGKMSDFYDKLNTYEYDYKHPEIDGKGKFVSIMAQELEKTELGKSMIVDTPHGKRVDYGKGLASMLAGQIELHKRLKELENTKKGKK